MLTTSHDRFCSVVRQPCQMQASLGKRDGMLPASCWPAEVHHTCLNRLRRRHLGCQAAKGQKRREPREIDQQPQQAPDLSTSPASTNTTRQQVQQQKRDISASESRTSSPSLAIPPPSASASKILFKRVLKQLSSLKLAIAELAVLAALSSVGTVIEQNKGLEWYQQNYPDGAQNILGFLTWRWILALQLDHIYTASYFLALMALLGASLAACTSTRQVPMVKVARRWRFAATPERVYSQGSAEVLPAGTAEDFGIVLTQKGYQVFRKGPSLYAFKGLAGRLGPIGVHASMLLCMVGIAISGLGGWKGSVMVPEGGDFLMAQALAPLSPLARDPPGSDAVLHVNSFDVDYRSDGSVAQFNSDISVLDLDGREQQRRTIFVNSPLRYHGVTAYQTDWAIAAVTLRAEGSPLEPADHTAFNLPMASLQGQPGVKGQAWATYVPAEQPPADGGKPRGATIFARDFQTVVLYDSKGEFVGVRRPGSNTPIEVEGMKLLVDDLVGSTGMELKADPGVPYVYAGFAGMMITTLVSYLSHSQVWALQQSGALHVGGRTNRATSSFQDELSKMLDMVPERAVASFGQEARSQGVLDQLPAEEQAEEGPESGPAPEMVHDDIANMATGSSVGR